MKQLFALVLFFSIPLIAHDGGGYEAGKRKQEVQPFTTIKP